MGAAAELVRARAACVVQILLATAVELVHKNWYPTVPYMVQGFDDHPLGNQSETVPMSWARRALAAPPADPMPRRDMSTYVAAHHMRDPHAYNEPGFLYAGERVSPLFPIGRAPAPPVLHRTAPYAPVASLLCGAGHDAPRLAPSDCTWYQKPFRPRATTYAWVHSCQPPLAAPPPRWRAAPVRAPAAESVRRGWASKRGASELLVEDLQHDERP